jgi:hypothetical protein
MPSRVCFMPMRCVTTFLILTVMLVIWLLSKVDRKCICSAGSQSLAEYGHIRPVIGIPLSKYIFGQLWTATISRALLSGWGIPKLTENVFAQRDPNHWPNMDPLLLHFLSVSVEISVNFGQQPYHEHYCQDEELMHWLVLKMSNRIRWLSHCRLGVMVS